MTPTEISIWTALAFVGILGSALCSGLEVGLYSVSRVLVRVRSVDQPKAAALGKQIDQPAPLLTTLLVFNNLFNYIATLSITALLSATNLSETMIIVIQAVVLTPILLIFAESIPKELFRSRANILMERLVPCILTMRWTLTIIPVSPLLTLIAGAISRVFGSDLSGSVRSARQHMTEMIKHSDEDMTPSQTQMIDRALLLNQTSIRTVMVPNVRAVTLEQSFTKAQAIEAVKDSNHSRYPVQGTDGDVIGSINAIDLYTSTDDSNGSIQELIKPVIRLNHKVTLRKALSEMQAADVHIAVVTRSNLDAGVITRKDLLSPLIATTHDW